MKCPYRIKTTVFKREMPKEALNKGDIVSTAVQDFAECYEDECPFFDFGVCKRAATEGGDI